MFLKLGEDLIGFNDWDVAILFGFPRPEKGGVSLTNILFLPAWLSLVLSEVAKVCTLLCQSAWSWSARILAGLSSIFLPALIHQEELALEMEKHDLLSQRKSTEAKLDMLRIEGKSRDNAALKTHLRSVENCFEHLPQLVISLSVFRTHSGRTRKILGDNVNFILVSAVISALSLIRGQE